VSDSREASLSNNGEFPGIIVNALRLILGDDKGMAEENAEEAVGRDGVRFVSSRYLGSAQRL
jgi:hypothetical protein